MCVESLDRHDLNYQQTMNKNHKISGRCLIFHQKPKPLFPASSHIPHRKTFQKSTQQTNKPKLPVYHQKNRLHLLHLENKIPTYLSLSTIYPGKPTYSLNFPTIPLPTSNLPLLHFPHFPHNSYTFDEYLYHTHTHTHTHTPIGVFNPPPFLTFSNYQQSSYT